MTVTPQNLAIPGPRHVPAVGWQMRGLKFLADPIDFLQTAFENYGYMSTTSPSKPKHVFVFGEQMHRELFAQPELFTVDAFRELRVPRGSSLERLTWGLLKINGTQHRRHRQIMQPAFSREMVRGYVDNIVASTHGFLDQTPVGSELAFDEFATRLTLQIGMETVFGIVDPVDVDNLNALLSDLLAAGGSPTTLLFPFALPGTSFKRALRTAEAIEPVLLGLITESRAQTRPGRDVLSALTHAVGEDGNELSDAELIGEAYTAFCHESTAASLCWTMLMLDQHPEILEELQDEIENNVGSGPISADSFTSMPMLDNVVSESLRLFPPAAFGLRYADGDARLGPYEIPAGASVFFSQFITHRDEDVFSNPLEFSPRRWESVSPSPFAYMPFGAGPHTCLGRAFALMELKVIISLLVRHARWRLQPRQKIDLKIKISLNSKQGFPFVVAPMTDRERGHAIGGELNRYVKLPTA